MPLKSKKAEYEQYVPPDLKGMRAQQLGLLNSLLGLPQPSGGGGFMGKMGRMAGLGGGNAGGGMPNFTQFFGNIGSTATPLQRQSTGGISQFLNQPAPEQRAMDVSMPALQAILGGAPGQGIMDALRPQFERNLGLANQQGGRFGSANAIMRSRAVEDYNLLGAQAAQQGQQTQLQAAQILGMLGGQAGQNPFERLMGAYGVGSQDAQQADLETERRLQILMSLLGTAQQKAFNLPIVQTTPYDQGFLRDLGQGAIEIGSSIAGSRWGAKRGGK